MLNESTLRDLLKEHNMKVLFTKANGKPRVMLCTRKPDILPEIKGTGRVYEGVIPVFDLEAQDWRSFRVDSVVSAEII